MNRLTWTLLIAALLGGGLWGRSAALEGTAAAARRGATALPNAPPVPPASASMSPGGSGPSPRSSRRAKPTSLAEQPPATSDVFASLAACRRAVGGGERSARAPQVARLASWNLRWFPDGAPGAVTPGTDLSWLACVMAWLDADVLAVQEVKQTQKAERALSTLLAEVHRLTGRRYRAQLDDCGSRVPQHVGLIFDEARVRASELSTIAALNPWGAACERQLRPGLSGRFVFPGGLDLTVVSVHFKSRADPRSLALRESSFAAVPSVFRRAEAATGDGDWLLLGDLNTMGCESCEPKVSAREELEAARELLQARGLRVLPASAPGTELHRGRYVWLDHAVVPARMRELPAGASVRVEGFCARASAPPQSLPLSDHCPLLLDLTDADLD